MVNNLQNYICLYRNNKYIYRVKYQKFIEKIFIYFDKIYRYL